MRFAKTKYFLALVVGTVFFVITIILFRAICFEYFDVKKNMGPLILFYMSPVIGILFSILALICEIILSRFWYMPKNPFYGFLIGLSYASPAALTIGKAAVIFVLLINPITVRILVNRIDNKNARIGR